MDKSLFWAAALNAAALMILCAMVWLNPAIRRRQKAAFSVALMCTVLVIAAEVVTVALDGADGLRWAHIAANYVGFVLSPLLPVVYGVILGDFKRIRPVAIAFGAYCALMLLSQPLKLVFYVDANNVYHRGGGYWIFLLAYLAGIAYLLVETVQFGYHFQNRNKAAALLLVLFLILGTTIQVRDPDVYISWTCVTITQILFYAYLNEIRRQVDGLTGLLNHSCFLGEHEVHRKEIVLIVLDVDRFKEVNDTRGHLFGDRCLRRIAKVIRMTYERYGRCYRIGGDEFAVILKHNTQAVEQLNEAFARNLESQRREFPELPNVSLGYAVCHRGDPMADAVSRADKMMYQEKKRREEAVWYPLF